MILKAAISKPAASLRYHPVHQWQGRTLIGTTVFDGGALRVTVNFDESFRTCTVDVVYGRVNGVPGIVVHGMNGKLVLVNQLKVSSPSCTITDGNIFGDNIG